MGKLSVCCAVLVFCLTVVSASYPWYGGWGDDGWGSDDGGYFPGRFGGMNSYWMPGMASGYGNMGGWGGPGGYSYGYNMPMSYGGWGCGGWMGDDYCGYDG
ncbi:keratin-associated protein 19-4-like [Ylistrum balloti]|uniref:keratin-associated protein 19-4-like n=1 Tax=Ylistrum balloti TaxID=509963 RepID=UPI002905D7C6|nr:keratin-associated protein 19-4-like [Ylistrum balloti]